MPKYYNRNDWANRGDLKIIPSPQYRRLPILKQVLPYYVGDKIKFDLNFDKPNPKEYASSHGRHAIYEQFGGNKPERLIFVDEIQHSIEGHTIPIETSVAYSVGNAFDDSPNKTVVFTTTVESWDTVRTKWALVGIGAILSLVCGALLWLLGFIELVPAWKMWIIR
jgi:hypothetical protein